MNDLVSGHDIDSGSDLTTLANNITILFPLSHLSLIEPYKGSVPRIYNQSTKPGYMQESQIFAEMCIFRGSWPADR